jgi:hypothetical protein
MPTRCAPTPSAAAISVSEGSSDAMRSDAGGASAAAAIWAALQALPA